MRDVWIPNSLANRRTAAFCWAVTAAISAVCGLTVMLDELRKIDVVTER